MQIHDFFVVAAQIIPVFLLAILLEYRRISKHEDLDPPKTPWQRFRRWSRQFFRQIVLGFAFFGEMFSVSMLLLPGDMRFENLNSVPVGILLALDLVAFTILITMQAAINSVFFGTGKQHQPSTDAHVSPAVHEAKQLPTSSVIAASLVASSVTLIASAIWNRGDGRGRH